MAAALTALSIFFLLIMLVAEAQSSLRLRYVSKPLASACFVLLALVLADGGSTEYLYGLCIVVGLSLGAIGDVALMFKGQRSFLLGLVSFLFGHAAYVLACALLVPPSEWATPYALAPVVAAAGVLLYLWPHLGKMMVPVLFYILTIVLMVVGALAVYLRHDAAFSEQQATLLLIGAILFFASDIAVAKSRFVKAQLRDRLWGLPAYYAGQLLIAWSLLT